MENMQIPFTKAFKECPSCGSTNRVANEVIQKQKDEDKVRKDVRAWLFSHQSMIADITKPHIQVPVVISLYDVCMDCGTVYCIEVGVRMGQPQKQGPRFSTS